MTTRAEWPEEAPFVLLDDSLAADGRSTLFTEPREVLRCDRPEEVPAALDRLVEAGRQGLYAAGFLAYELGYLLEPRLRPLLPARRGQPLLWMGLFEQGKTLDPAATTDWLAARSGGGYELDELTLSCDEARYLEAFDKVKDYIAAGDVYQINLTLKYDFNFTGNPFDLYNELRQKQRVSYGALMAGEDFAVLSLSPELFLEVEDGRARARPMKGTAPRGRTPTEDRALRRWLREDPKSRAENLMIVDLLRNDLGRSALIGSVRVGDLFHVETYPTVHQMTSGIEARLHPGVGLAELLAGLFPCGSVTGAPKVRAMEIIRELETAPRGVYTGAVGMIAPGGDLRFNVAIRTLWLDRSGHGEMGIGSGVVYDSDGRDEYRECLLKARFLTDPFEPFELIETLRWDAGEYWLLDHHLDRLEASARYFLFTFDRGAVRQALDAAAEGFVGPCQRVRLLLSADGTIRTSSAPLVLPGPDACLRYVISEHRTDSRDPFFYHKTTRRALYDGEHARLSRETDCDEVLFLNQRGELAEGSRTTLFIARDDELLTPPIDAGILDGVLRRALIETRERPVREATLHLGDLENAEAVYLGNSVRGLVRAEPLALPKR
jgi:para-aminobenzoate synthetase/4-amino-4-deoxychorismate lyase